MDPKQIARRYLTGFFAVDVIATFPFGLVLSHPSLGLTNKVGKFGRLPKLLKFLRAAKLLKLVRLQQFISRLETEYNIHHGVARMVKVISLVFLVTHVVGCFFYLIGLSGGNDDEDGGWMFRYEYHEKPVGARYVASMYWAFSTLTTVSGFIALHVHRLKEVLTYFLRCFSLLALFFSTPSFVGGLRRHFSSDATGTSVLDGDDAHRCLVVCNHRKLHVLDHGHLQCSEQGRSRQDVERQCLHSKRKASSPSRQEGKRLL